MAPWSDVIQLVWPWNHCLQFPLSTVHKLISFTSSPISALQTLIFLSFSCTLTKHPSYWCPLLPISALQTLGFLRFSHTLTQHPSYWCPLLGCFSSRLSTIFNSYEFDFFNYLFYGGSFKIIEILDFRVWRVFSLLHLVFVHIPAPLATVVVRYEVCKIESWNSAY